MTKSRPLTLNVPEFIFEGNAACAEVDPELFFPQETEDWAGRINPTYKNVA